MSVSIELTAAQTAAVADLAETEGTVSCRCVRLAGDAEIDDVYVTVGGSYQAWRVDAEGHVAQTGEFLPGPATRPLDRGTTPTQWVDDSV